MRETVPVHSSMAPPSSFIGRQVAAGARTVTRRGAPFVVAGMGRSSEAQITGIGDWSHNTAFRPSQGQRFGPTSNTTKIFSV